MLALKIKCLLKYWDPPNSITFVKAFKLLKLNDPKQLHTFFTCFGGAEGNVTHFQAIYSVYLFICGCITLFLKLYWLGRLHFHNDSLGIGIGTIGL